ncbi:hypothetical protein AB7645_36815 [Bradyrhizobium sp. 956_D2_N1_5]|uniref:hypothetical protein n=1 Tax=unclassified Bradyrhizobium TaxID=2631580 RepID=UPI003F230EB2
MKRRRDGLIGFPEVARRLKKSLAYTYQLSSADAAFPPVEKLEDGRKFFSLHAVAYYQRYCRRWYRRRSKEVR